jgi:hypothetical protein
MPIWATAAAPAAANEAPPAPLSALRGGGGSAKKESITARLAQGEAPWDMLSLKAAIHAAAPGKFACCFWSQ